MPDTAISLSQRLPQYRLASRDIALGEGEVPIVMGVDLFAGEPNFYQPDNGLLFSERTEELLHEVYEVQQSRDEDG